MLLDGTYNTTVYDMPLYFLCVKTNVGMTIVSSFLVSSDTKASIREALSIISQWNSTWKPKFFMCDCDTREIDAVETVFAGRSIEIV